MKIFVSKSAVAKKPTQSTRLVADQVQADLKQAGYKSTIKPAVGWDGVYVELDKTYLSNGDIALTVIVKNGGSLSVLRTTKSTKEIFLVDSIENVDKAVAAVAKYVKGGSSGAKAKAPDLKLPKFIRVPNGILWLPDTAVVKSSRIDHEFEDAIEEHLDPEDTAEILKPVLKVVKAMGSPATVYFCSPYGHDVAYFFSEKPKMLSKRQWNEIVSNASIFNTEKGKIVIAIEND